MRHRSHGFSMLEVLITLVILAFGLLGLVNLQIKLQMNEVESYQRGQALMLLNDMTSRLRAHSLNPAVADDLTRLQAHATGNSWLGVGGLLCSSFPAGTPQEDCTAWDELLEGAAIEQSGVGKGAMVGARGCVTQVQAADLGFGVCRPPIFRVSVAWQGLYESATPAADCAADQYGADGFRRTVSTLVVVGSPRCL